MFLTEKRSGEIKARACTNGSTQRTHMAKEQATVPTGTSEEIFIKERFLHMRTEVSPHATYLGHFFRWTTRFMFSCASTESWQS